ncbi:hypothetical protein LTS10_003959 [Elasticomyces elasticus]|nr:hypothetical protein LTS10_003959 [Elasticomyces elasticus]
MPEFPIILIIGGTGAQGLPVVKALSETQRYAVRVLTRSAQSARAQELAGLPNVSLIEGTQDQQKDLHTAFTGVYGAWVNLDGFTLGEKNELFYGIRAYEIARHHGVKHYIFANTDYALRKGNWDEQYHWGHNDAKGRVGDLILSHGQEGMKTTLLTTGPYMDMLFDGMYVPKEQSDGSFLWGNPAANGKIPLIALDDVGEYSLWIFNNPSDSAGLDLEVATDQISFPEIAAVFTRVTGKKGIHKRVSLEEYLPKAEPYPNAWANWSAGSDVKRDESSMTWRQNFSAWWRYWSEGKGATRDMALLDRIHPNRIKSLEEWMRLKGYDDHNSEKSKDDHVSNEANPTDLEADNRSGLKLDRQGLPLVPQPSDHPDDPLNFSRWFKIYIAVLISGLAFIAQAGAGFINPAFRLLAKDLGVTVVEASYCTTVFILFGGILSMFTIPFANVYGRRICHIVGGSVPLGLGVATICDIFTQGERGTFLGLYTLAVTNGPHIAPIAGGYIAERLGWRWNFWIPGIIQAAMLVVLIFTLPETLFSRRDCSTLERKTYAQKLLFHGKVLRRKLHPRDFGGSLRMAQYAAVLLPSIWL